MLKIKIVPFVVNKMIQNIIYVISIFICILQEGQAGNPRPVGMNFFRPGTGELNAHRSEPIEIIISK